MSQTGSVPMSLRDDQQSTLSDFPVENARKEQLSREILDLTKKRNKLLEQNQSLEKAGLAMQESAKSYQIKIAEWKANQLKETEIKKQEIIKDQVEQGASLDKREAELSIRVEFWAQVAEYYLDLADELVWWSSQNDDREEEIRKEEVAIRKKRWTVDDMSEEAETLVKRARVMLETAKTQAYSTTSATTAKLDKAKEEALIAEKKTRLANQTEVEVNAKLAKLESLKLELDNREKNIVDREKTLMRAQTELAK